MATQPMVTITVKVSRDSQSSHVAGAIAGIVRDGKRPIIQSIGMEATDRAVKSMAMAVRFMALEGIVLGFVPEIVDFPGEEDGSHMPGIRMTAVVLDRKSTLGSFAEQLILLYSPVPQWPRNGELGSDPDYDRGVGCNGDAESVWKK